ncbi:hypothetical protein EJB05_42565, partial [Eragrostis curvula]
MAGATPCPTGRSATVVNVGFLNAIISEWAIRVLAVCSLTAHVVLAVAAGVRRREATSPGTLFIWLAYQFSDWAPSLALSKLTFGSTPHEQELVALWLPFFLMHLGRPDNITALSLEDNKLSMRKVFMTIFKLLGTVLAIYKQYIAGNGTGSLLWASVAMLAVGVAKYLERATALRKAELNNIRTSRKNQPCSLRIQQPCKELLGDEQALLVAHELLHITKGAFADYWVKKNPFQKDNKLKQIFSTNDISCSGWKNMGKVVEMEISLMYDIIYTKAALTDTSIYYFVRVASPIATAATTLLFWLSYNKDGQRTADVIITYILLVVTILLDVRWLLSAAVSTWTFAYLNSMPECWLHHEVLCNGRWRRLRLAVMALDLREWLLPKGRCGSYRLWSGNIGQYNMFHKCTNGDTKISLINKAVKKVVSEDTWIEYNYSKDFDLHKKYRVKELLFKEIERTLMFRSPVPVKKKEEEKKKSDEKKAAPDAGLKAHRRIDEALDFLPELLELILIWHIATDIFLWDNYQELKELGDYEKQRVKTIQAMSNYMVFLAVARPDMLPGVKLRSLCELTSEALEQIWQDPSRNVGSNLRSTSREQNLAKILLDMEDKRDLYKESLFLSDAAKFAKVLKMWRSPPQANERSVWEIIRDYCRIEHKSQNKFLFLIPEMKEWKGERGMKALLDSILRTWVRMLILVSTRCSRDSHVKQLGRGGELTTIVWILRDHVGIFGYKERLYDA